MRNLFGALAVALFASVGAASAGEETTGTVMAFDEGTRMLSLENGETFLVEESVPTEGLEEGREVTVSYERKAGQYTATEVQVAEADRPAQDEGAATQEQGNQGTQ